MTRQLKLSLQVRSILQLALKPSPSRPHCSTHGLPDWARFSPSSIWRCSQGCQIGLGENLTQSGNAGSHLNPPPGVEEPGALAYLRMMRYKHDPVSECVWDQRGPAAAAAAAWWSKTAVIFGPALKKKKKTVGEYVLIPPQ